MTEGVRLSLLTERKCCAFCEKHGRRNQESDCDHFGDFLRISSTPDAPILFAIRRMYQANSFRHALICPKNVIGTLRSSEAGRRGRRPLPRLSQFSAKPKRRPHFGGEGHSRGAKTDPVFAPDTSPNGGGLENEARRGRMVGVDALGDPSCANMKRKPCGFHEAPALRATVGVRPRRPVGKLGETTT